MRTEFSVGTTPNAVDSETLMAKRVHKSGCQYRLGRRRLKVFRNDSRSRSHSGSPDLGVPPQVQHREHGDDLVRGPKVDGVRESVQQRSVDITAHCGELEWALANARERSIDIAEESFGEAGSFVLVPLRSIREIGLGKWPNDEPAGHSVQWLLSNFFRRRS
jgi:hypothetical protein